MKRLILFAAIFFGLMAITRAQKTEKVKTKIEGQGFKKKIKTEGDVQANLTSTSAHPAYVHHNTTAKHHYAGKSRRGSRLARHITHAKSGQRHVAHYRHAAHYSATNVGHYKKVKRKHENGDYKVKYKA